MPVTEELKKQSTGASLWRGTRRAGISNEEGADQRGHQGPGRETSAQEELGRKEQHMEERDGEEERLVPSESNPDALRKKREGGAEEGIQSPGRLVQLQGEEVCVKSNIK